MTTPESDFNFDGLSESQVTLGETTFYFDKIPAKPAAPIFRRIISELKHFDREATEAVTSLDLENKEELRKQGAVLMRQIINLRPEFIDWLETKMFQHVRFSNQRTTPQQLAGAEDMAFGGLNVYDLHEVLVRSLAVNFLESFSDFLFRKGISLNRNTSL